MRHKSFRNNWPIIVRSVSAYTLQAAGAGYFVIRAYIRYFFVACIIFVFWEMLSVFVGRSIYWFNPKIRHRDYILHYHTPILTNHANYILTTNASLVLCEGPPAATMVFQAKYTISPSNSSTIQLKIMCWIYLMFFEMCNMYCGKINSDKIEVTKWLSYKS